MAAEQGCANEAGKRGRTAPPQQMAVNRNDSQAGRQSWVTGPLDDPGPGVSYISMQAQLAGDLGQQVFSGGG